MPTFADITLRPKHRQSHTSHSGLTLTVTHITLRPNTDSHTYHTPA